MKKNLLISYALVLSVFAFVQQSQAQTPTLQNKSVFCYGTNSYAPFVEQIDDAGNKYYLVAIRDSVSFNGKNIGRAAQPDRRDPVFVKTNQNNELLWSRVFPGWSPNSYFFHTCVHERGIAGLGSMNQKESYTVDGLPAITNEGRILYYALSVDSVGENTKLFPLLQYEDGLPIPFQSAPYIGYDNDTIILSGSVSANARFGSGKELVPHPNGRTSHCIARFTSDGELIDVQFPFYAGNVTPRGLVVKDGKAYCSFDYRDTLRSSDGTIRALPDLIPDIPVTTDAALLCYDLREKKILWSNTLVGKGDLYSVQILDWHDNIALYFTPGSSEILLNDSAFATTAYSRILLAFDKGTGQQRQKIVVEGENTSSSIVYEVENASSVFVSVSNFQSFVQINGVQIDLADSDAGHYFRISDGQVSYLGKTSSPGRLATNKAGINTIRMSSGTPNETATVFGTETVLGECSSNSRVMIVADLSELTNVKSPPAPKPSFFVYPNPSQGIFVIEAEQTGKDFVVTDLHGRILKQGVLESNKTEIDLSGVASGVYFVRVESHVARVVIE